MKILKIFTVLSLLFMWACGNTSKAQQNSFTRVQVTEFSDLLQKEDIQLIDVRTPQEYALGHIENAQLIDFTTADFSSRLGELDKNKPVLVYCAAGGRSYKAGKMMEKAGFTEIYELQSGFSGWASEGKPIKK